ncbi:MAG: PVC-type heme-binding CxxCH protein [Bryobacterales bacterium]
MTFAEMGPATVGMDRVRGRSLAFGIALVGLMFVLPGCSSNSKPVPPKEALKTFQLPEGFRIELVAAEPNVVDPVAMAFDEQGRLLVVEMSDYPLDPKPRGRVKRLEDRDGDGYFEHAEIFAAEMSMPTGVMPWGKGILVTAAPDILYFEDTNQDGRADVRQVVLTGFAATNPQLRVNGLLYGLDNWIYAAYPRVLTAVRYAREFGDSGTPLRFPEHPEKAAVAVHSQDVRFKPREAIVEPVAGNSQFGNTFDAWGNRFTLWNNDHVRHVVFDDRYLRRNPLLANPLQMFSASDHENAAKLFPITVDPEYIHDSQHGRFTSACGISAYTGGSFPPGYEASTFVCDPVHNIVHRDVLAANGPTFTARRSDDSSEFLASTDSWFRPVFTTVGPDGALYVADYHRQVVEHPEFAPEEIVDSIPYVPDAACGRIYRVVHASAGPGRRPDLGSASPVELVRELSNPNLWWRTTAQRLLVARQDKAAAPALDELARNPDSDFGRLHALWTLQGLGTLDEALLEDALGDRSPAVREQALRLAEDVLDRPRFERAVFRLIDDPDARVELRAAGALAGLEGAKAFAKLQQVALRHIESPWFQTAVLSSSPQRAPAWFSFLRQQREALASPSAEKENFFRTVAAIIGARASDREIAAVLGAVTRGRDGQPAWWSRSSLQGLAQGLGRSQSKKPKLTASQPALLALLGSNDPELRDAAFELAARVRFENSAALQRVIAKASETARNEKEEAGHRAFAMRLLGLDENSQSNELAIELLTPHQPEPVQIAAVETLNRLEGAGAVGKLLPRWRELTGPVREAATEAVFGYSQGVTALLDAVESEQIPPWGISERRRRQLLQHPDQAVQQRARSLFAALEGDRKAVYERYRPALGLTGDAARGREVFRRVCSECHQVGGMGSVVGPDLLSVVIRNKEVLMTDILDPNRRIEAGFEEYLVETADGRTVTGVVGAETPDSITLRRAKGEQDVIRRDQIRTLRSLSVSGMPADLDNQIDVRQMADLLAFLKSL